MKSNQREKNQKFNAPCKVWLSDLTYTQQTVASEAMPLGIGMIAAYAQSNFGDKIRVRLFKWPDALIKEFLTGPPHVIGFSNYLWNSDLCYRLAEEIKRLSPATVIIFGGPNYPIETEERQRFLKERPAIDFYIFGEGEKQFTDLLRFLMQNNFDIGKTKKMPLAGCHYFLGQDFVCAEPAPRLDIKEVPSPYLLGLMDKFFEDNFMPLIQTVRGCPFCCTYCCEGQGYFNKVSFRDPQQVAAEIEYVAKKSQGNTNLNMADSNFGQYPQDLLTAQAIARAQEKYGYPQYIHVAAGKGNKERVLAVARTVKGAMRLSASVQSTDPVVLANIKRTNVPLETLVKIAQEGNEFGSNTYSEIILALSGDSKKAHLKTIETMMNMDLSFIRCFTLMIFKGADLGLKETRRKFGLITKFRVLPRCFGLYQFGSKKIFCAEIEEVCVANNTLSFKDYLACRLFYLTVEIFYNDGILAELFSFAKHLGIQPYDLVAKIHRNRRRYFSPALRKLYRSFLKETRQELWNSSIELEKFVKNEKNIKKYLRGEYGSNLIFKYKTLAYIKHLKEIHNIAFRAVRDLMKGRKAKKPKLTFEFLDELKKYSLFQKANLFDLKKKYTVRFSFDMKKMAKNGFGLEPVSSKLPKPIFVKFKHNRQQLKIIKTHLEQFGNSFLGLARILSRVHIKKIYRQPIVVKRKI